MENYPKRSIMTKFSIMTFLNTFKKLLKMKLINLVKFKELFTTF